ncbi:MAG: GNAT family N-acetyltransferase [Nannocystaceae bacterium]|nr:GNAT family N-acetyltransferase [Nannocystaceae bacterium]
MLHKPDHLRASTLGPLEPSRVCTHLFRRASVEYDIVRLEGGEEGVEEIIQRCREIEARCWRTDTEFRAYAYASHRLLVARADGGIVGFVLLRHWVEQGAGLVEVRELMVLPEFQGRGIGRRLGWAGTWSVYRSYLEQASATQLGVLALSGNPKVLLFAKHVARILTTSSFQPSQREEDIAASYLQREGYKPLVSGSAIFVQGAFPRAYRGQSPPSERKIRGLRNVLPDGFDGQTRGDAMVVLLLGRKNWLLHAGLVAIMLKEFGPGCFLSVHRPRRASSVPGGAVAGGQFDLGA